MGVAVSSGSVNVNGTVTASLTSVGAIPTPNANQTIINVKTTANAALQSVYTVPAGKTFYLFGVSCVAGGVTGRIYKNDGTTSVLYFGTTATEGPGTSAVCSAIPINSWAENEVVKANVSTGEYYIWGVLQ